MIRNTARNVIHKTSSLLPGSSVWIMAGTDCETRKKASNSAEKFCILWMSNRKSNRYESKTRKLAMMAMAIKKETEATCSWQEEMRRSVIKEAWWKVQAEGLSQQLAQQEQGYKQPRKEHKLQPKGQIIPWKDHDWEQCFWLMHFLGLI